MATVQAYDFFLYPKPVLPFPWLRKEIWKAF